MANVGVLALQGDVREHLRSVAATGAEPLAVKHSEQLDELDGLIIPGGESTTIMKMAQRFGLFEPLRDSINRGLPTYGTCAGMIVLASALVEGDQPLLGSLDVVVRRNAFGRQNESFEADVQIESFDPDFHAVFIRAPWVEKVGAEVDVLAKVDDHPVMVRQGHILATSFHPELTGDSRIHQLFVEMI